MGNSSVRCRIEEKPVKDEIRSYVDSNPRLGTLGHAVTEEVHDLFIQHGAVKRSIETEAEDALILGDMMKSFQIS